MRVMRQLARVAPGTYYTLKLAAAIRHELLRPVLGTHANDWMMKKVYPV